MSVDDHQVQNMYRYSRRSYKKNRRDLNDDDDQSPCESIHIESPEVSPRSDGVATSSPRCRCDLDPEVEIANILHKKCPVINLAQQQLERLLDETDKILCNNTRCCRLGLSPLPDSFVDNFIQKAVHIGTICDFLNLFQHYVREDKYRCVLILFMIGSFFTGLLVGAASCGSHRGRFNSPILTCVDNYFMPNYYESIEESYRSVV